eukprot:jgi/Ulvmu1/1974/UM012_0136.1
MKFASERQQRIARAMVMQLVQRRYLSARLNALQTVRIGITFALAAATIFGVLQALYSILTVPHEYGHVWAAHLVGHKVSQVQVDFLDRSEAFIRGIVDDTDDFVDGGVSTTDADTNNATSVAQQSRNFGEDGRMGFVVYEPSILPVNTTTFQSIAAYNSYAEGVNEATMPDFSSSAALPVFPTAAVAVSSSTAESGTSSPLQVLVNDTHHLEISASPTAFQPASITTRTQDLVPSEATVRVVLYHDTSNAVGRALGTEGIVAIRSMGGPAMEAVVICSLFISGALCCASGFAIWGTLFTSLGVLMDALTLDYAFMSAFSGLEGDYEKAARSLHSLAGWDPHAVMAQWALAYVLAPLAVFAITYWAARTWKLRRLPRAHAVRMLCNLEWSTAALRGRAASSGGGEESGGSGAQAHKPAAPYIKRAMVVSRRQTALQAPQRLIASVASVLGATMASTPRRQGESRPVASDGRGVWGTGGSKDGGLTGRGLSGSMPSGAASGAVTGATHVSNAASVALGDTGVAQDAVKAMGGARRKIAQLMRRYHGCLSAALWDVRGTRRLLRRAKRVALAETVVPARHWVARMVKHCEAVARLPELDATTEAFDAQWTAADSSWSAVCGGTARMFRSLHHILLSAGGERHRRAVAAWTVRRYLLVISGRADLLAGPVSHWWPLLHTAIITTVVLSRLCHLSGHRPAVGAPATNSECAQLISDLAAAAVVLNVAPLALALRALHLWPWHGTGALELPWGRKAAWLVQRERGVDDGKPPALVVARRRGRPDPPVLRSVKDAREAQHLQSTQSTSGVACTSPPSDPSNARGGSPIAEALERCSSSNTSILGSRGVRWPLVAADSGAATGLSSSDMAAVSSSTVSSPATPPPPGAAPPPAAATPQGLRSHPLSMPGTRAPSGPGAQPRHPRSASFDPFERRRPRSAAGAGTPEIVPEDSAVYPVARSSPAQHGRVEVNEWYSADVPIRQFPPAASAFAVPAAPMLGSVQSGDMGNSNTVAQLRRLESGDGPRETLSMFAWPWAEVSRSAQGEAAALKRPPRPVSSAGPATQAVAEGPSVVAAPAPDQAAVGESADLNGAGGAAEQPRRGSWWGRGGAAATMAQAVRATVRFAQGTVRDDLEAEHDTAAVADSVGGSGGWSAVPTSRGAARSTARPDEAAWVSDMAALCGWAARLQGDAPPALRRATAAPWRIQVAWLLCNVASALLCACVGGTEGWAQLQLCCVALLWITFTTAVLEYRMACLVSSTWETHLAALHTMGWSAKCKRAQQYFDLRQAAAAGQPLSASDAAALQSVMFERKALEAWFRQMQMAACLGMLTPQQLDALGRVERAESGPDAWVPLGNADTELASKSMRSGSGALQGGANSKWIFSSHAGSPDPPSPRRRSGALGATDIIIDVPMHVAAAGGGGRRSGDSGARRGDWIGGVGDVAPALAAVEDGVDSSSDGSGSIGSGLDREDERAIEHAAAAGAALDDGVSVYDDAEAELAAALTEQDLDGLLDVLDDAESAEVHRLPDSLAGFGSMLRRQGVRTAVRASVAHVWHGVVGAVLDDAEVAREAAESVATGVLTTALAGRATVVSMAARSTELRKSLRRTAHGATMRRGAGQRGRATSQRQAGRE